MAQRKEARIFATIWDDPGFRNHSPSAQRMYFYLLSQVDLSYCGVIALRERRWARDAKGLTVDQVIADLEALAEPFPEPLAQGLAEGLAEPLPEGSGGPLVVIDEDSGEVLVRSLIRHDGIWRVPNLLKSARESATLVRSPRIKAALIEELQRLPLEESPSELVSSIVKGFIADLAKGLPATIPQPPPKGSANPSAKGSANPSPKGSQGIGERNVRSTGDPRSPVPPSPDTPKDISSDLAARATDVSTSRPEIDRICTHLADRIAENGCKRPAIGKKWRDAARLMLDSDGRSEQQIHAAIDWCQNNEFWRRNIMSLPKLRDQYDRLRLQAEAEHRGAAPRPSTTELRVAQAQALKPPGQRSTLGEIFERAGQRPKTIPGEIA